MAKTIIVSGVARGGTSMLTGLLNQIGVKIAYTESDKQLLEKQLLMNPKGAYESNDLHFMAKMSVDIINAANEEEIQAVKTKYRETIIRFRDANETDLWGFKIFGNKCLPYILEYFDNPYVAFIFRNPVDNAKSYKVFRDKLDNINFDFCKSLEEIIEASKLVCDNINYVRNHNIPMFVTTYERLRTDTALETCKLHDFLGMKMKMESIVKAINFVDDGMKTWKENWDGTLEWKNNN